MTGLPRFARNERSGRAWRNGAAARVYNPSRTRKNGRHAAMRLKPQERDAIAQAAHEVFAPGTAVFLFGSRVDDSRRGGDIDLLIETPQAVAPAELVELRTRFVSRLYRALDEQRIDIIMTAHEQHDPRPVVAAAKQTGILLAQV